MKVTLGKVTAALDSKAQAIVKILISYSSGLVKKLQDAGTYAGMHFIAGLPRTLVLKTVKEAARAGVFGDQNNWAHSDFFDQYPISNDESWAEFLLALVFDPASAREKAAIYDRLIARDRNAGKTASASTTVAFFGKIRDELKKRTIRNRIRKGGFQERPMEMEQKLSQGQEHRMNKNNPWGANMGYSAAAKKTVKAGRPESSEEVDALQNVCAAFMKALAAASPTVGKIYKGTKPTYSRQFGVMNGTTYIWRTVFMNSDDTQTDYTAELWYAHDGSVFKATATAASAEKLVKPFLKSVKEAKKDLLASTLSSAIETVKTF